MRQPNNFLIVLPLIAFVILIDQITKTMAINNLCVFGPPGQASPCTQIEGLRLVDTFVRSLERIPTFFPLIDLDFYLNRNAALSMPIPGPIWFEYILLVSLMILLAAWLWREGGRQNAIGIGFILGGALGNFVDRLLHGGVVDFLALHFRDFNAFIFNVADAAITLGVIWLFVEQLFLRPRRQAGPVVS